VAISKEQQSADDRSQMAENPFRILHSVFCHLQVLLVNIFLACLLSLPFIVINSAKLPEEETHGRMAYHFS
jgi:hypothetical protein